MKKNILEMKKKKCYLLFSLFLYTLTVFKAQAQTQKRYFTQSEVNNVYAYLNYEKHLIWYYSPNPHVADTPRLVSIEKIEIKKSKDYPDKYEVYVKGKAIATFIIDKNSFRVKNYSPIGMNFEEFLDLAYVYVKAGSYYDKNNNLIHLASCLGLVLGYDINVSLDSFDYPLQEVKK